MSNETAALSSNWLLRDVGLIQLSQDTRLGDTAGESRHSNLLMRKIYLLSQPMKCCCLYGVPPPNLDDEILTHNHLRTGHRKA